MTPAPLTYNWLARQLHWIMAALIFLMFLLGLTMTALPLSSTRLEMITWHKWLGISLLAMAGLRLIWRLVTPHPKLDNPAVPPLMEKAAKAGHMALYLLLFAVPLIGWMYSSAAGFEVILFEIVRLPDLVSKDKLLADQLALLHEVAAWSLMALVAGHIFAVLIHHLLYKDPVITRMRPNKSHLLILGVALAVGLSLFLNYRIINPPAELPVKAEDSGAAEKLAKTETAPDNTAATWKVDHKVSQLEFTATQKSAATKGSFKLYQLTKLHFDPITPEAAEVTLEVDISTLQLGNTLIEQTLLAKGWFDVKAHPKAIYQAKGFTPQGDNRYQLEGNLTINGITKPQLVELTIVAGESDVGQPSLTAEGTAEISRTSFNIGEGEWASTETLQDKVTLKIKVTAIKPQ